MSLSKELPPVSLALTSSATTFGERIYSKIITTLLPRIGERWTWGLLQSFYYEAAWTLFVVPLVVAEKMGWLEQWRIQPGKSADPELVKEMYRDQLKAKILTPLIVAFTVYPLFKYIGKADLAESIKRFPDWREFLKGLLICAIGEDTLFYWTHRALHSKYLYRFHKQHHRFKQPIAAIFDWADPVEAIFGNMLSIIALPALFKIHPYTFYTYFFFRISEAVSSHSGFNLPFFPMNWFQSVLGGAERHDYHHAKNVGAYGSLTKFWDWICGTDKTYWAFKERQRKGLTDDQPDATD